MYNSKILLALSSLLAISIAQAAMPTNTLPSSVVLPTAGSKNRGFIVRTSQAPTDALVANNSVRALRQINGTLTDATGARVINEAIPGEQISPAAAWSVETINFELGDAGSPVPVDVTDIEGNVVRTFDTPALFPGIPGAGGHFANFAVEAVGFLKLPAGITVFGVSVSSDRTDVNDDDGYAVFVGANPRDFFGTKIGEYDRNAFKPFASNQRNENTWAVNAPTAGLYPVRLLYWQTGHGANLQLYTVNEGGERILVNDPLDERAIPSYLDSTSSIPFAAYVAEASPGPGSDGVAAVAPITVTIADAKSTVQTAGVGLFLSGSKVLPQSLSKTNGLISLVYTPNATRTTRDNLVRLEYTDSEAVNRTNSWNFGIVTSGGSSTIVTGQWDFEQGDLRASVGQALAYFDSTFDGPTGSTADKTSFGTASSYGLTALPGGDAKVLRVPGTLDRKIGYVMTHGISPNGGGTRVNQYTLIMDVYVATSGPGAASLWQTSSLANSDDGDLFWQGSNFGQGGGGYNGRGTFTAGAWHRVVAAYDMSANPPVVVKYVDGVKQDDWTANQGLDSARRTLQATAILFGDGDQDERREMFVNSIQIRSGKLSDAECFSLGSPTAAGIPKTLPQSSVTGQWDFEFGDLSASIGASLAYLDPAFDGPAGSTDDKTSFGLASAYQIPALSGGDAAVLRVPGTLDRRVGYVMNHRISPNGGGSRVNQYTLIMDVFVATSGPGAASLWQTSSLANSDDGDLFWQGNNFGQGGGGYNGRGTFTAGAWHRVAAAYDMAANPPVVVKYVDGIKQDDWTANQGLDSARRALQATAILFGDGDQDERREMFISSVQIRSERLSDAQMFLLGGPTAAGIPVSLPTSTVTGQWDFGFGDLSASIGASLAYLDPAFDGPSGAAQDKTAFGTVSSFGLPALPKGDPTVMRVPGTLDRKLGYVMAHRIAPNGGGSRVNQYTLVLDMFIATSGPGAASLLQTSSLGNTDDGDLFWQGNNFGQGGNGYNGTGIFTTGAWHRVVAAYDMAATPPVVTKFIDGIKQDDWTANQSLDNPRRALQATSILFADGDQDERREMWIRGVQIRSGKLSDTEMVALGSADGDAIPVLITDPSIRPEKPVTAGAPPAALGGVALIGVVDTTAKTIIADLPSNGAQGYLSIHPMVTVTSVSIVNGKLVIRYQ